MGTDETRKNLVRKSRAVGTGVQRSGLRPQGLDEVCEPQKRDRSGEQRARSWKAYLGRNVAPWQITDEAFREPAGRDPYF